ncbi:helix-turn-helix domain-containing protein [Paenibacillus glycanilyticus]|uniref:AraC family transcriptional regulator n=1 Tax=Paenibacillus glycanilyticus TaxID=126569 RepID=A0ABQ6GP47_9BACL|nr:helix-turn-helix domain-containing protein [Paenibacillus glycanilyticus]GLX71406.1 AraC family transcriptional regulator [Paenibacillus glycanilyticus]
METAIYSRDLSLVCKLIQESCQLPVFYAQNNQPSVDATAVAGIPLSPLFPSLEELVQSLFSSKAAYPMIRTTNFGEQFIIMPVKHNDADQAFIVIGPSIQELPSEELMDKQLHDYHISYREKKAWSAYYESLPRVNRMRLLHICVMANLLVNQESLELTDVLQHGLNYAQPKAFKKEVELSISAHRESLIFHPSIQEERKLFQLIQIGDTAGLMMRLAEMPMDGAGVLAKRSQVRNIKNLAICGIALGMRAAIDGGLFEEQAYMLSDLYIQQIEELHDVQSVEAAMASALLDFAERVGQSRNHALSKPVKVCREYIYAHLYEEITVDQLAELCGLNSGYLMHLFKKETGQTLTGYMQKQRIEEAKKLLQMTGDTISSIGSRLGFYDQAHFIKVFKKHAGVTPKFYRGSL